MGLFLLCLDKVLLESLCWACNLVKNIVTCCLFLIRWWLLASRVETLIQKIWNIWEMDCKLHLKNPGSYGKSFLSLWNLCWTLTATLTRRAHGHNSCLRASFLNYLLMISGNTGEQFSCYLSLLRVFSSFSLIYMLHSQSNVQTKQVKILVLLIPLVIVPAFIADSSDLAWASRYLCFWSAVFSKLIQGFAEPGRGMMFCDCEVEWS